MIGIMHVSTPIMAHCEKYAPGSNRRSGHSWWIELLLIILLTAAFLMFISSCTSLPRIPSPTFRAEDLETSALRDKIIVIDPGHGGKFGGAVGKRGLKESEVNLCVGLYLWGLLNSAGAQPVMTRTADTTVGGGSPAGLSDELSARSSISNNVHADIFISIHHNANVRDPGKNDLAVFYQLSPPDPSRELATCIAERMKDIFGVPTARVLPGNFSVLRKTGCTAILGEASYLTHRENEKRLHLHRYLKMEAEAYFAGILDYCRRGIPSISVLSPSGGIVEDARPEVVARVTDDGHGTGIDASSIKLYLDAVQVRHAYDPEGGLIRYRPEQPLAGGRHAVRVEAKNRAGNSARPGSVDFTVSCPPAIIEGDAFPGTVAADGSSRCRIWARVLDDNQNPLTDGTPVTFRASAGRLVESEVPLRKGLAVTHLVAEPQPGRALVTVSCGTVSAVYEVCFAATPQSLVEMYVHDQRGDPVPDAEAGWGQRRYCTTDRLGYCWFHAGDERLPFTIVRDGYLPVRGMLQQGVKSVRKEEVVLRPVDEGLLHGKVIMIDPRGEEEALTARGSSDRQRWSINLDTALRVKELLQFAGAGVVLTRADDPSPNAAEKVLLAEQVSADLVISLDHEGGPAVGYYYNSAKGRLLAGLLGEQMAEGLFCKRAALRESTDFLIVHTGMPAVSVGFGKRWCKSVPADKEVRSMKEAQAVYRAVRSYFAQLSGIRSSGRSENR